MQTNPPNRYIELKINRDFGDIITVYFDFLKQNLKKFTNIFLSYNGIFLVGLLIVSYLLVTGFVGLVTYENNSGFGDSTSTPDEAYVFYFIAGGILFAVIFIIVAILNYSLAGAYMVKYESKEGPNFEKKEVWDFFKDRLGNIIVFVLLLIVLYVGLTIVNFILLIIPIVGVFARYILQFFTTAWIGVSFYCMLAENKGVTESFGEGWNLVTKNFWKSVGVQFIIGILNVLLIFLVLMIPGGLITLYTYHVIDTDLDVSTSIIPTIVWTIGLCAVLITFVYYQCLSQFVNCILYSALHEKTYNTNTRSKIEQIGVLAE